MTMADILSNIGSVFTEAIGWVGDVAALITGEPILLLFTTIGLVGLGVGLFKRLTSR